MQDERMGTMNTRPRIIIIGAGFGGLYAARTLQDKDVDVLLIDRRNYHTFTPLLYQVATMGLEAEQIAYPVRGIFRADSNVAFMLGEVAGIDSTSKTVTVHTNGSTRQEAYDYLIVAAGSVTNFFGNAQSARNSFELKTLDDAVTLRNHILRQFERATWTRDEALRQRLTTLVVVGGGPTGLETGGALVELFDHVTRKESGDLKPRIVLVEAQERLLTAFPDTLQGSAYRQLQSLGVEVMLSGAVSEVTPERVRLTDGTIIPTETLIWSAGVKASPLADMLGVPLARGGRVPVTKMLEAVGLSDVYVVGDMAYLEDENGQAYPAMIPAAKQEGILAARNILRRMKGWQQQPFRFIDRGIMATIGRNRAVAYLFGRFKLTGFPAWVAWLGLHLITLMGFRNRIGVFINWAWSYFSYQRPIRLILGASEHRDDGESQDAEPASSAA
jgi:NADH dehydrogenase